MAAAGLNSLLVSQSRDLTLAANCLTCTRKFVFVYWTTLVQHICNSSNSIKVTFDENLGDKYEELMSMIQSYLLCALVLLAKGYLSRIAL